MFNQPQPGQYSVRAAGYIALAECDDILQLLADLMNSTATLFESLSDKADYAYEPGKWTIKEVLSHLIDTERVFAYRALCISRGEQQNLPGFEQDDYAAHCEANSRVLPDLIGEYQAVRLSNLYFFRALSTAQANRMGSANGSPATVSALAHMIAGHELHHINILKERYV
jgi:hypothetical protein